MNIITCTESLRKFLIVLRLTLLLTKPQLDHLASLIVSAVQGGFDGKMKNIPAASMFAITLEKSGGSETPTLSEMYVAGKVG